MPLSQDLAEAFAAALDRLGPFEPRPALAIAVSGGADSMALAVLTRDWVRRHDGSVLALVVDHGLRPASSREAGLTIQRLSGLGIPSRLLELSNLAHGSALAERARSMRYAVLEAACAGAGVLHLLLGHQAADQVETLAMRVLRGSGTHGLSGMAALRETSRMRLLRPLLAIDPVRLRRFLTEHRIGWVEDPSNQDLRALRPRLRQGLGAIDHGTGGIDVALAAAGAERQRAEAATAAELAERATIRPEGFALLSAGRISAAALSALIRTIAGAPHQPAPAQVMELAAKPRPATLAGVRIMAAGRLGDGFMLVREEAATSADLPAADGVIWDGRFRLVAPRLPTPGTMIGALGSDATQFRTSSHLPSAVLRTLPAVRFGGMLVSVPNIGYRCRENDLGMTLLFIPKTPVAGPSFAQQPDPG